MTYIGVVYIVVEWGGDMWDDIYLHVYFTLLVIDV